MRRALVLLMVPMMAFAISWQADIDVTDGTSTRTISWGVSPLATDGYDFGIDENFPILPPSGLYAFFPISDPTNPYVTMLSADIRRDTLAEHIWKFTGGGVFDTLTAQWNPLYLPVGDIFVGVSPSLDEPPAEMIDMTSVDQIRFYPYNYVWIDFTPAAAGDVSTPPFVVSTYPEDGAVGVVPNVTLQISLSDNETGIDPASISLTVNGVDVTPLIGISRDGDNWVVSYHPDGGFTPGSTVNVHISFADFDETPNTSSYSFYFTTGEAPTPVLWEVPIVLNNLGSTGDTTFATLYFGVAEDATDMFDPAYDVPLPSPVPGTFYAYFPLYDPGVEFVMLSRDIRSAYTDNTWTIRIGNPGVDIWASWDSDDLPDDVNLYIASAYPPDEPTDWLSMSDMTELHITVGQWLWIRETLPAPPDTEPPYLVSSTPEIGAVEVPPETELSIVVSDWISGVDESSIQLVVNGEDVTDECTITTVGDNVYITYSPDSGFEPSSRVDWQLYVADNEGNATTIEGYFNTGFYPTPEWLANLYLDIVPAAGDESEMTISFGVDEAGTDHFDIGLDYLYAPPPPGATNFYFYIDDTIWTQLARDIRSSYADSVVWTAVFTNVDVSSADYFIRWSPDELPEDGEFMYSITDLGGVPEEWFSMRDNDSVPVLGDGKFYIMYRQEIPTYCLSGTVVLEGTGDYSGTVVEIPLLGLSDTTDVYGHYEICDIPAGTFLVQIHHDGYVDVAEEITITSDMNYDAYLELIRYTVSGVVVPEDIPEGERDGILVVLDAETTYTDSEGYFEFADVLPGSYTLHIECEGYVPVDTAVEVVDSDVSLEIPLYLVKYTVSGWVELSDRPAGEWAGTEVMLGDRSTTTDSVGYFEFDDVLPGTYSFSASHGEEYVPFETTLTVDEDVSLTITLEHIPVDSGNVLVLVSLEGGGALNGTRVVLVELGDTAYTNPMGRARLRGVPYGTYTLEVSRENYQTYTQELVVDAPAETVNVMLYLKRGIIDGFVYLSDTVLDLSGSIVVLDGSDTAETDITGYFGFSDVAYGEHTLHFEHGEDYVPYDTTVTLTDPGTVFVSVTLEYAGVALNPPQNVNVISGYHNRVAVRWDPPEPTSANLLGYGVIRSSFSGIDTIAYVPYWCTGYIDYDGVTGLFSVFAVYEEGNSGAVGYLVGWPGDNPDAPDVLILDFDNGALLADNGTSDEALALRDLLWTGQVSCQVTDQDQDLDDFDLLYYRAVFVVTGISDDDNTMLSDESLMKLFDYLAAGGRVYWEGADVAADYATMYDSTFGYIFGAFMADDGRPATGMGNVATLYGQPPYFEDGVTFDYQHSSPADHYVDEFYATSTSSPMLYSQGDNPPPAVNGLRMVANDFDMAEFSDYTSRWRDVVSSVYLGAIDYRDDNSNAYEVLRGVWRFLFDEELPAGVEESEVKVPDALTMTLSPTPFNSSLEIALDVPASVSGELKITDITGKTVAKLYEGELKPGVVKFRWDADELTPSGTYLVVFSSEDGQKIVRKAVLLR